jgi:hypothetical protein
MHHVACMLEPSCCVTSLQFHRQQIRPILQLDRFKMCERLTQGSTRFKPYRWQTAKTPPVIQCINAPDRLLQPRREQVAPRISTGSLLTQQKPERAAPTRTPTATALVFETDAPLSKGGGYNAADIRRQRPAMHMPHFSDGTISPLIWFSPDRAEGV